MRKIIRRNIARSFLSFGIIGFLVFCGNLIYKIEGSLFQAIIIPICAALIIAVLIWSLENANEG